MKFKIIPAVLRLFDGEGGAAAPAAGDQGGTQGETNGAVPGSTRRGKSGEFSNVVFGKQDPPQGTVTDAVDPPSDAGKESKADVQVTSNTLEERRKAFRDMIQGEYKDLYTEETQRIIDRRFRDTKQMETRLTAQQPVVDLLLQRYGIEDGDVGKLQKALEDDREFWDAAAEQSGSGMTGEQYQKFMGMKAQNAALLQAQDQRQNMQRAQQQVAQWEQEADALRAKIPSFQLETELQNTEFQSLLRAGVPMEHAYRVVHLDSIVADAVSTASQQTAKAVTANVRARGARPAENGTAAQSAFTVKDDVSKLTRRDRAEIARRVQMGEKISF